MAENIRIYPGRHFTIDEISGVYLSNFDLSTISWSTVSDYGHEEKHALMKQDESQTDTTVTFYQSATRLVEEGDLPYFNVIALFNETTVDGHTNYELLTYGILGTIQETASTSKWQVNIQLEWSSQVSQVSMNLLKVYLRHTQDTSSTSYSATETINQVHEKIVGLGAQDITNRAQRIAFYYDNKVSNDLDGGTAPQGYTQYLDAGQRLTNNNLLFITNTEDSYTFGDITPDPVVDPNTDISNGGLILKARGSSTSYLDDVTTYCLDAKRASYIPDTADQTVSKNIKNTNSMPESERHKALSDFTSCIIGTYFFPQLIEILYSDIKQDVQDLSLDTFSQIFVNSYQKATMYFDLAKGMGFFLPLDDFDENAARYFILFPCGTNDFVVKIFKLDKNDKANIPTNTVFMPVLYVQQASYFIQYDNGVLLTFSLPNPLPNKKTFSAHKDYQKWQESPQVDVNIPSNPWCFPQYNETTHEWAKTNDMPSAYEYAIFECSNVLPLNSFTTINMNDVGLIGNICTAPQDIRGLVRYYHLILDKVKSEITGNGNTGTITPFDGISYKILDKIQNSGKIDFPSGSTLPEFFIANDAITFSKSGSIQWSTDWELTEEELYDLYYKTYRFKHDSVGEVSWLSNFYNTIKDGIQNAVIFESSINGEQQKVSSSIPLSTLDWDSLSDVGNPEIEQLQFDIITQGFTRSLEAIKNTFNYGIARTKSVKWMFFDNAVVTVDHADSETNPYYYITVMKYSDKYGANLFRQVIPSSQISDLQVTYSSDILTLKFKYRSETSLGINYTSLYDLNARESHKPIASLNSTYENVHTEDSTGGTGTSVVTTDNFSINDLYYSNGLLFQTENSPTHQSYYKHTVENGPINWYSTNGIRLLRKIFYDLQ